MWTMKNNPIMIIFGLGVFLTGLFSSNSFAAPKMDFTSSKLLEGEEIAKKASVPDKANKEDRVIRPVVVYSGQGLRDPFEPLVIEKKEEIAKEAPKEVIKPLPPLQVQGLLWGGDFPQAIINNKVVKVGDSLGEVKITAISKEGVTVFFAGKEHHLSSPAVTGSRPPSPAVTAATQPSYPVVAATQPSYPAALGPQQGVDSYTRR